MARRRINVKFLIGLIAVLAVLVVVLGGAAVYVVKAKSDPQEDIDRGMVLYEQRHYRQAAEQFGKALSKRRRDVPLLMAYVDCISHFEVRDSKAAQGYVHQMRQLLTEATEIEPDDPRPFQALMRLLMTIGQELGQLDAYNYMRDRAAGTLKVRPDMILARKYRGIATVRVMDSVELLDDSDQVAEDDLRFWLDREPDNQDLVYHLALWNVIQARKMRVQMRPASAYQPFEAEARRLVAEACERLPNDLERKLNRLDILIRLNDLKSAAPLAEDLEQQLLIRPELTRQILELVRALPLLDAQPSDVDPGALARSPGLFRAVTLLESSQRAVPNDLGIKVTLGRILRMQGKIDQAMAVFDAARKIDTRATAVEVFKQEDYRLQARVQYVDLLLAQADADTDPRNRAKMIDEAEDMTRQLKALLPTENGLVTLLEGKIAMARGQWHQASVSLDRANTLFANTNPEAALLSARARKEVGELGAAVSRLTTVVELRPGFLPARYELAQLYIRLRQFPQAQEQIDKIMQLHPGDVPGLLLQAAVFAETGRIEQAVVIYQKLDPEKNPQLALPLAQLYKQAGRNSDARKVLERRFDANPQDLVVLQQLLAVADGQEAGLEYIRRARVADTTGGQAQVLDLLERQFADPQSMRRYIQDIVAKEPDAFRRHFSLYQLALRDGDRQTALRELALAAKENPDHAAVISAQFDLALADRDLATAQKLAQRAAELNLDLAEGAFFLGRVAMERNQFDRAVTIYQRGLVLRPIFSDGWRQLGDAQRAGMNLTAAAESYQKALDQRPDNVAAMRGLAFIKAAQRDQSGALSILRRALEIAPNDRGLRNVYLAFEEAQGDARLALTRRRELALTDPSDLDNRRALAVLNARQNRTDEAIQGIDSVIATAGMSTINLETKAAILTLLGKPEEGRQLIQDYIRGLGDKATAEDWVLLARFLLSVGQVDPAMSAYRQGVALEDTRFRPVTREMADQMFELQMTDESIEHYRRLYEADKSDSRVGLRLAEAVLRRGTPASIDEAQKILNNLAESSSGSASFFLLQHLIARARNDEPGALAALEKAIELTPSSASPFFYRAQMHAMFPERDRQARADLARAIDLDPGMVLAYRLLASLNLRAGDPRAAMQNLETALVNVPRDRQTRLMLTDLYFQHEDWARLSKLLADARTLFPEDAAWVILQARSARAQKKHDEAVNLLRGVMRTAPSPQVLGDLAQVLIDARRFQDAVDALRQEAGMVSATPQLQALRGRALCGLGQNDQAMGAFAAGLRVAQSLPPISFIVRTMVESLGFQEATSQLRQIIQPGQEAFVDLSLAEMEVKDQRYTAALERLRAAQPRIPAGSNEAVLLDQMLAISAHQNKQYDEAYQAYQRLLRVSPNNVQTLNNLAYLLVEMDRPAEGLPFALKAVELAPNDAQVLDTLGWVQFKSGNRTEARRTLERSVDRQQLPPNCLHLGQVILSFGERGPAAEWFRTAHRLAIQQKDAEIQAQAEALLKELQR